jgi:PucR C-terminal helix-turn-helix domain/GGDEF-like domain
MRYAATTANAAREPSVAVSPRLPKERSTGGNAPSPESTYAVILDQLKVRQAEINTAIFTHVHANTKANRQADAEYEAGAWAAVLAVVDYWLAGIEAGDDWSAPVPLDVITQVRRVARAGANLEDAVLSCVAVHRLLGELALDEIESRIPDGPVLRQLRRMEETVFERLIAATVTTFLDEHDRLARSGETRRQELVLRLLAGDPADDEAPAVLRYELRHWHLGAIANGVDAEKALRALACELGRQLLLVSRSDQHLWAWLGGHRKLGAADLERALLEQPCEVSIAIGEQARGLDGWRLTHAEAQAAWRVALRRPQPVTRCADVPLDAAVLQDEVLAASLARAYLAPLDELRMGGPAARETLRAYCACDRSVSSAAHLLGVTRKTVESRLREIETALDRPLRSCVAELQVALRLEPPCTAASSVSER